MRGGSNGSDASKTSRDRRRQDEANRPSWGTGCWRRGRSIGATRGAPWTTVGVAEDGVDGGRRRQANRQRGVPSDGRETSDHRAASRVGDSSLSTQRRGVEPASGADAGHGGCRGEDRQPRRSPARSARWRSILMGESTNGSGASKTSSNRRRRGEANRPPTEHRLTAEVAKHLGDPLRFPELPWAL